MPPSKESAATGASLQTNIMIGLIGVFITLSFQFRSYLQPLAVLLAIPTGLIGVVWGRLLDDLSFVPGDARSSISTIVRKIRHRLLPRLEQDGNLIIVPIWCVHFATKAGIQRISCKADFRPSPGFGESCKSSWQDSHG